jgi:hypothetical protein
LCENGPSYFEIRVKKFIVSNTDVHTFKKGEAEIGAHVAIKDSGKQEQLPLETEQTGSCQNIVALTGQSISFSTPLSLKTLLGDLLNLISQKKDLKERHQFFLVHAVQHY